MTIGQRIKELRTRKGLSQRELGAKMNVSQQMIGQYENSATIPKIDTLRKIADALDCSIIDLDSSLELEYADYEKLKITLKEELDQLTKSLNSYPEMSELVKCYFGNDPDVTSLVDSFKDDETLLLNMFRHLNTTGKDKTLEYTNMLTKIPEFVKTDDSEE